MPIIRNPFKKDAAFDDENAKPSERTLTTPNGFVAPDSAPQDIKQPTEYKLSGSSFQSYIINRIIPSDFLAEINDSGVFLPVCVNEHTSE